MATRPRKVEIRQIHSGVPGLDPVLGGGIPAYSVNMVVGPPGAGKTTLVHQFLFHNASPSAKALYFVALGEPTLKMLRYQQQYDFFDLKKVDTAIQYHELGTIARDQGLKRAMDMITERVEQVGPAFVVIDSFRGLKEIGEARGENIRSFVHDISSVLATWNVTTFLLGEYLYEEILHLPEFSAADGILYLSHQAAGNAVVRKIEPIKIRGQGVLAGRHSFRISKEGVEVFPRMIPIAEYPEVSMERDRLKFGVAGLDTMMDGGIPRGEVTLIAGSSGTGKTLLAIHFIAEGVRAGEPSVMITFEEHPREHERKALGFGWNLADWTKQGLLTTIYLRPLDFSVDEVLARVHEAAKRMKAKRVVINSISGFEMGIAPGDEPEFREALYRLVATLTGEGVTTVLTTEIPSMVGDFRISPGGISFLADNIIALRYVEIQSSLRKALMVVKMRTSNHDKDLRQYNITKKGLVVERPFTEYSGILSGVPTLRAVMGPQPFTAGLTDQEESAMHVLLALGEAPAEQLADSMGIDAKAIRQLLDKLVDTGYVAKTGTGVHAKYRVALITPGAFPKRK